MLLSKRSSQQKSSVCEQIIQRQKTGVLGGVVGRTAVLICYEALLRDIFRLKRNCINVATKCDSLKYKTNLGTLF